MNFYEIDKNLKAEFASKRLKAEKIAENNLAKVSGLLSYIKIDTLLKDLIIELSKPNKSKSKKEFEKEVELLRKEKVYILSKLNLTESDLVANYSCKVCNDTGFVGNKTCECFQKRRNEEIMKACGLTFDHKHNFKNYSTKDVKNKSQANTLKKLKTFFEQWTNKFPNVTKQNILIGGSAGVGKTYLAECVATELFAKNCSVCFLSAFDMNNMLTKFHTTFSAEKHFWIDPLIESDVLIIDDLGTEPTIKNVTINYLYLVLSERNRFKKSTIITTNLEPESIMERYGERIFSRIMDKSKGLAIYIPGDDLRLPN